MNDRKSTVQSCLLYCAFYAAINKSEHYVVKYLSIEYLLESTVRFFCKEEQ